MELCGRLKINSVCEVLGTMLEWVSTPQVLAGILITITIITSICSPADLAEPGLMSDRAVSALPWYLFSMSVCVCMSVSLHASIPLA